MIDDGHAIVRFLTVGGIGFAVVFLEMRDVFRVGEIFFAGVWFEGGGG